jgi:nitrate/nitrite transporter NarK
MFKSRKVILFLITLIVVVLLSFFDKDTASIITLFGVYCCGNVGAKFSNSMNRSE